MRRLWFLVMALSAPAYATTNQIDFNLGHASPRSFVQAGGSSDREGSQGDEWTVDILHKIGNQLYIGIGSGRFHSDDNVSPTFVPAKTSTLRSKATSTFILGRFDVIPGPKGVFYALAGVGWVRNSLTVTATPNPAWQDTGTAEQRTLLDDTSNAVGYTAGGGLDISLSDRIVFGIEARYQGSAGRSFNLTPEGLAITGQSQVSASLNLVIVSLKVGIKY